MVKFSDHLITPEDIQLGPVKMQEISNFPLHHLRIPVEKCMWGSNLKLQNHYASCLNQISHYDASQSVSASTLEILFGKFKVPEVDWRNFENAFTPSISAEVPIDFSNC